MSLTRILLASLMAFAWACAPTAVQEAPVVASLPAPIAEGECPARDRATALASEADALMSTDVPAAIARYREALELDPTFADRWHRLGLALIAEGPSPSHGSEQAKGAFQSCIEKDPNFAECYFALGEAALWTDDMPLALYSYSKAIEHSPGEGRFYAPLVEAYLVLKRYDDAEQVVEQGMKNLELVHRNRQAFYDLSMLSFLSAASRGDLEKQIQALEIALEVADSRDPEVAFLLGRAYAMASPPQKESSVRLLKSFSKRACRGTIAKAFRERCETSSLLLQRLGQ